MVWIGLILFWVVLMVLERTSAAHRAYYERRMEGKVTGRRCDDV